MTPEEKDGYRLFVMLGLAGLVAGIGTLLASHEVLTLRLVIGRAMSSLALGVSAASVMTFFPDLPETAMVGIACVTASLGTSGLERLVQKYTKTGD